MQRKMNGLEEKNVILLNLKILIHYVLAMTHYLIKYY